jgi:hypothetical protein
MADDAPVFVPAHVRPYVAALGRGLAMAFIERFGGAFVYLSAGPGESNEACAMVGADRFRALRAALSAGQLGNGNVKVPLAKPWLAGELAADGLTKSEIARRLKSDVATVRRWLNGGKWTADRAQPSLFDDDQAA